MENIWMSRDESDRINGDRINGLFQLLINGVYWDYNPLILTIDPNFLGRASTELIGKNTGMNNWLSSWRFQPIWNIFVRLEIFLRVKIKHIWNHHLLVVCNWLDWMSESLKKCFMCYKKNHGFWWTTNHSHLNVHPNSQEQISDESEDDSEDSIGADVPSLLYRVLILVGGFNPSEKY